MSQIARHLKSQLMASAGYSPNSQILIAIRAHATMKHAGPAALDTLEDLLVRVRGVAGLTEKKRGVFYRKSVAFLHFHEDPAGFFADLRVGTEFQRFPVNSRAERAIFFATLERAAHLA